MNDELNDKIDRDVPAGDGGHPSRAGEPAGHPGDREAGGTVSEESVRAGEQNKQDVEKLTVEEEAAVAEEMTDKEIRSASEGKFGRLTGEEAGRKKLTGMYKEWFLDYASYVILERAVPHVEDGLKPVQRRILHAMKKLDDGRYNKVANIIGSTMQYHPHGDASIGDALVQLGQKELLIDCQGNWGNILTGDGAAAPRYIEARLSKFALDVVFSPKITEWMLSYDGRNQEPVTLPLKFPLLLAQGVEGIAVGLALMVLALFALHAVGKCNLTLLLCGGYVIFASGREMRGTPFSVLQVMAGRGEELRRRRVLPVRTIAVREGTTDAEVYSRLLPGALYRIVYLDEDLRAARCAWETELLGGVYKKARPLGQGAHTEAKSGGRAGASARTGAREGGHAEREQDRQADPLRGR